MISRQNNGPKIECALLLLKLVCSAARMSEEERSREGYTAFYIARKSHPSRILIGRKYEIEISTAKIIPAPDNKFEIISFCSTLYINFVF